METLSKLIDFFQRPVVSWGILILFLVWLALNIACCVFGGIALHTLGKQAECAPLYPAYIPGGQVWFTLRLAKKERLAARAEIFLWWYPVAIAGAVTAVVWAAYRYLNGGTFVFPLLGLAVVLLGLATVLYIWIRGLELRGLSRIFKDKKMWIISVVGAVLGIPVQRVLLFWGRKFYLK